MPDAIAENAIIQKFFSMGRQLVFRRGDLITGNEERPNGVYFIQSGYIKAFSISESGTDYGHILYGRDEIFPIAWAYLGNVYELRFYQALEDTLTWRLSRNWFLHFIRTNPDLGFALTQQMARQFQLFMQRVDNLEYTKAHERVAYQLLFLYSRFGKRRGNIGVLDIPLTHEILASSINLARETVSREMEKLNREHIIASSYHHIEIINMSALIRKVVLPTDTNYWHL